MLDFLLDRKHCIAFLVIGWLVRGMAYHFFPLVNEILTCGTVFWIAVILISEMIKKNRRFDWLTIILFGLLAVMILSSVLNYESIRLWKDLNVMDVAVSIIEAVGLFFILFTAAKYEESDSFIRFLKRLFLAVFCYVILLAAASVFLFLCYRMNISLPGGFGGADQIFTYGHMGEETRFCGLFGYSTDGGNLCVLAVALAVYLYDQKKLPLFITVSGIILLAATIYLLDVRTSMIALILNAFLAGGFLLSKRMGRKRAVIVMTVLLAVGAAAVFVLKQDAIRYYLDLYREDPQKTLRFLTTGRSTYWAKAVQGWKEKPLFGWGWLNNAYIGMFFDNHNVFFNLLLWTGAAGTVLFVIFALLWFIHVTRRRSNVSIGAVLIIMTVCVQAMLDRAILGTANTGVETMCFWLCTGLMAYGPTVQKGHQQNK